MTPECKSLLFVHELKGDRNDGHHQSSHQRQITTRHALRGWDDTRLVSSRMQLLSLSPLHLTLFLLLVGRLEFSRKRKVARLSQVIIKDDFILTDSSCLCVRVINWGR